MSPTKSKPGGDHRPSCVATIFSDDHGKSWKPGQIIVNNGDFASNSTDTIVNPSESVAVELADGRIMMNIRNEAILNRRLVSYSKDGSSGWTKPAFDQQLFEPVCMASMITMPGKSKNTRNILFINPDSRNSSTTLNRTLKINKPRENLTVKLSYDEGKTWPVQKSIFELGAGYSDVAVDTNGNVYCLCEVRESKDNVWRYKMILRRFNLEWLTQNTNSVKN